ncbi:hypothetical protein CQY20_18530 [Mycolicibacterium agri]|nr:hypothetical protein CQY20_18530 [Mycolicibacterium agri]
MDDDAGIADLPWASVFDPAANVRALSAIQARGFRAATEVVDRFVRITEMGFAAPTGPDDEDAAFEMPRVPEIGRIVKSLQKVISQLGESALSGSTSAEAGLDLVNSATTGEVRLDAVESGSTATEVWLHNRGPVDMGKVRLRCSDLLSHDGAVISSSCVRFEPDVVPMPARCSRGVTIEIDLVPDQLPGCYRGTLLADGHADVWLPVVLNVKTSGS